MQEVTILSNTAQNCIVQFLDKIKLQHYAYKNISRATSPGDNFLGVILKVDVVGKDQDGNVMPLSLILKTSPKNEVFRKHASIHKAYVREIYVYTVILPEFIKLQQENNISVLFNSFVECFGICDREPDELILMENAQALGYSVHDRKSTLDYNHALLVMKEYGRFHALSFVLRNQNPQQFHTLATQMEDEVFNSTASEADPKSAKEGMKQTAERGLHALDPVCDTQAYNRFKLYHEHANDLIKKVVSSQAAGRYAVFGHGDCWLNNILFKYENLQAPNIPTKLCFIDWQFSRLGSPALDLSYFLCTCIDDKVRDNYYTDLILAYYSSLCAFLREFKCDPEKLFPFKVLDEHLKQFSVYGLHMALISLYIIVSDPDEIPNLYDSNTEEETMEKFQYKTKNIQKYYERFGPVVKHFVKCNYDF